MTRLRSDKYFGSAWVSTAGAIIKQSNDLVSVAHPGVGVYQLNWARPIADTSGLFLCSFSVSPTGDFIVAHTVQPVPGSPNSVIVNFWTIPNGVDVVAEKVDTAFLVTVMRMSQS